MNFANVKTWTIQEGEVLQVKDTNNARIIWSKGSTPGPDYSEPFYVENITNENETVRIVKSNSSAPTVSIEKSNDAVYWETVGTTSTTGLTLSLTPNQRIYLRAKTNAMGNPNARNSIRGCSKVGGNVMSLLYGNEFTGLETSFPGNYTWQLSNLFRDNRNLLDASELILPVTTLSARCYYYMFEKCNKLLLSPIIIPARVLADYCCSGMFSECSSLTTAPVLPATTLAGWCYDGMFGYCSSLTTAPVLPATTLASSCYAEMFEHCSSLTTAPALPATTLAHGCYFNMFAHCSSLTTAPVLPATTLAGSCYASMFRYCSSLTAAPALPATTLANGCYFTMFEHCASLKYVKCLATSGINIDDSTISWLNHVSSTGTFVKAAGITWPTGVSGIPSGWTVQEV